MRVLVTEKLSEAGLELLRQRFQVDVREDLAHGDLAAEIAPYDALVIRSATRVTAEVLEAAPASRSSRAPASASTTWTWRPRPGAASWS